MLVSVIIPAYKQEKTIKADIERIVDVLSNTRFEYEVIVVVDGHLDKTYEAVGELDFTKSPSDLAMPYLTAYPFPLLTL